MKKGKFLCLIISLFAAILGIVFIAIYFQNYSIAWHKAGFQNKPLIVHIGIDNNGNEYQVVAEDLADSTGRLAILTKQSFGIWSVSEVDDVPAQETGLLTIGWMRVAGIRRFAVSDTSIVEYETHRLYYGNNAITQINIPQESLPSNVTVSILQAGSNYMIHFTAYGDAALLNQIDCYALLNKAACIKN